MSETTEKSDVLIVGAGPAGLTAAIYSAWLGMKTTVLESGVTGGRAALAPKIENFPGFENGISGGDLIQKMSVQAVRFHAEFRTDEEVVGLDVQGDCKKVVSRKHTYEAPALIIATGTQRRKLRVPGETEFLGRGVSYCAICDGPFFRRRAVAVVGNSEEAAAEALALADLASKVSVVSQANEFEIDAATLAKLRGKGNVDTIKGQVTQILGEQTVKTVKLTLYEGGQEQEIALSGVFVSLGGVPMTAIVQKAGIVTETTGCLRVDRQQHTNVEGVFAAGDCTCGGMQVVTAAGEGAMAAMRASAYVRKNNAS